VDVQRCGREPLSHAVPGRARPPDEQAMGSLA
jgi:hypothetical protein